MSKPKLEKFSEVNSFPNVFQNFSFDKPTLINCHQKEVDLKGKWKSLIFGNNNPLVLELACGKGDYTVHLAEKYRDNNFIGIDVKGNRIWTGAKYALDQKLDNVAFVRTRIENLESFFDKDEVDEIWITFPDPFPKKSDAKKRLSSRRFLKIYKNIATKGSTIHFKTDNKPLFDYSIESVEEQGNSINKIVEDIYGKVSVDPILLIQTYYEKMHIADGRKIYYFNFQL